MEENTIHILIPEPFENLPDNIKNWLSGFSEYLGILLDKILPFKPLITIDSTISGSADNQVVIFMISPDFLSDGKFVETMNGITQKVSKKEKNLPGGFLVFKVCILPVPSEQQPEFLRTYSDYRLCHETADEEDEFTLLGVETKSPVWSVLVDLAYDISRTLEHFTAKAGDSKPAETGASIYLAETTQDQTENRETIKRELIHFGYQVVPRKHLLAGEGQIEEIITGLLNNSSVAIHLVGSQYGEAVPGSELSIVDLQLKLSAKTGESEDAGEEFERIIWFPPDLKPEDEKQRLFIENLIREEETEKTTEIVQTPLEALKSIIRKKVLQGKREMTEEQEILPDQPFVYLIHEERFNSEIEPLLSLFREKKTEVVWSGKTSSMSNVVTQHRHCLANCTGVLIYYSGDNLPWMTSKIKDLLKAPGYGRIKPIKAKAVILRDGGEFASPLSDVDIIPLEKDIPEGTFNNFLEKIN
ncbi:MAG: hypothetical protein JSV24_10295 [Bacteroidales bacterium]|nr:MAG: hypothetical protein JSV24_10295 [Bacteroidales bacterium]